MRRVILVFIFLLSVLSGNVFPVQIKEGDEAVILKSETYVLEIPRDKGSFYFKIKDKKGNYYSVHREGGEIPWFGYNDANGEKRTSDNVPSDIRVAKKKPVLEVQTICPVDPGSGSIHKAVFFADDNFVTIRSRIEGENLPQSIGIVRLAPRFVIDRDIFTYIMFSTPKRVRLLKAGNLKLPAHAGVRAWGGPQNYDSLNPSNPFFAMYNPDLEVGFMFIYPFYAKLWKEKSIFLQVHESADYFYAGFGEANSLSEEVMFVIAPLKSFSPDEIEEQANRLTQEIEKRVLTKDISFPLLQKGMDAEEEIKTSFEKAQTILKETIEKAETLSPEKFYELEKKIYQAQVLSNICRQSMANSSFDLALQYAKKILDILKK